MIEGVQCACVFVQSLQTEYDGYNCIKCGFNLSNVLFAGEKQKRERNSAHYNMDDMVWDRRNQLIRVARIGQSHWTESMILFFASIRKMYIYTLDSVEWTMCTRPSIFFLQCSSSSFIWLDFALLCLVLLVFRLMALFFISFPFIRRLLSLCSFCDSYNPHPHTICYSIAVHKQLMLLVRWRSFSHYDWAWMIFLYLRCVQRYFNVFIFF